MSPQQKDAQLGVNLERRKAVINELNQQVNNHANKKVGSGGDIQSSLTNFAPRWTFGELEVRHLRALHNYFLMKNPNIVGILPKFVLKRSLTTHAFNLMEGERILRTQGTQDLSPGEVKQELISRGLEVYGARDSENKSKLEMWIENSQLNLDPSHYLHRLFLNSPNYIPVH